MPEKPTPETAKTMPKMPPPIPKGEKLCLSVQGDVYAGVAQKLTEGLNIKSQFNAASCKGVP